MSDWKSDPPSNRQIKVLKFFDCYRENLNKGSASREILKLFKKADLRAHWYKYVFLTNDYDHDSCDLRPYTYEDLKNVDLPENWLSKKKSAGKKTENLGLVLDILKEGVPFDDPLPAIDFEKAFCLTGTFEMGTRSACEAAIASKGGLCQKQPTLATNYLIVGGKLSSSWSHETFGKKIIASLKYKLRGCPLHIVSEQDWASSLNQ